MRTILLATFIMILSACNPIDSIADKSAEKCQDLLNQQVPEIENKAWALCTDYYENVVLPQIRGIIQSEEQELVNNILTKAGCVPDSTKTSGWNCSGSDFCAP